MPWQETFADRFHAQRIIRVDAGHQVQNTRPHALAEILRQEAEPCSSSMEELSREA
ncbi:hypothetical protein D3C83_178940 [compost metagenome]